ncbi:MAG TPA: hypothetical protein VFN56_00335 [Candidatus Saccharimonadales bacterium]|nr:hypothetical protein [Candidatus Saccharimonadales bacterium]
MKNKNMQIAVHTVERAMHQRIAASVVVGALLLAAATVEHEARNYLREAITRPAYAALTAMERENETARMPVRFDEGLRLPTVGGA